MSVSALGSAQSGMQGYQRALDISANNVANTLSSGFQPKTASFKESAPSGSGVSVSISAQGASLAAGETEAADAPSGTDLNTEMVNQLVYSNGFDASAAVLKSTDQMLGSLIDIKA